MLSVRFQKKFDRSSLRAARRGGDDTAAATFSARDEFTLDVEFSAPPGITILFGASGSGKTTTLKAISGLIKPDAGLISIDGKVLFDSTRRTDVPIRTRGVGYVFQNLALFPHLTARANIEFGIRGISRKEQRRRAQETMEKFSIRHIAERSPRHISGGEAQRVALARALASEPRILLLDEPLSALDDPTKLCIIDDLIGLNRTLRLPIIYVTHSREEAYALGERVLIFERGCIVAAGAPGEVFGAPVRASVARLTGVENIFDGVIIQKNDGAATMLVELKGVGGDLCRVEVPRARRGVGQPVTIGVRSGDIMLAAVEPRGLSARNILKGSITTIEERGDERMVRIACGVEWASSITKQSVDDLGLRIGHDVWLAFKTYSCRVFDEDSFR